MQRRTVLRRATGVAVVGVSLAGCSGGDSDETDEDGTDEGGGDGSGSDGPSETGQSGLQRGVEYFTDGVANNVSVTAIEEVEVTDTRLEVDVTLRNDSDEAARMDYYAIVLQVFSSDQPGENGLATTGTSPQYTTSAQEPTPAGETVTLGFSIELADDAEGTIRSYKVTLACGGAYSPPGCE